MKLLRDFYYEIKNERTHIYWSHLQMLDQRLRLMTEQLAKRILFNQVKTMFEYCFHLKHLKINITLIKWFYKDRRFFNFINSLQLFQLQSMMMNNSRIDTFMFCKKFIKKMKYQKWKKNDLIILLNIFDWILNKNTWCLIMNELHIYMWHQWNDLKITKHNWLQNVKDWFRASHKDVI